MKYPEGYELKNDTVNTGLCKDVTDVKDGQKNVGIHIKSSLNWLLSFLPRV